MKGNSLFILLTLAILLMGGFVISDAYAYIDPGSGSLIIQMIIGALVGVGITIKLYWHKLKYKFEDKFSK